MPRIWAGAFGAAALAMMAVPAVAGAHCTSSTPSSASFADSSSDGHHIAPEITTVAVSVDDACRFTVDPGIAKPLAQGSGVLVYVDTDGDQATGVFALGGADVAVMTSALAGKRRAAALGVYDPWADSFYFGDASVTPVGNGGFTATLDQLGIAKPATAHVAVFSLGVKDTADMDFAPEAGRSPIRLPFTFAFDGDATSLPRLPPGCKVPRVTGFTERGARRIVRAAGCGSPAVIYDDSSTVPRGHVISSSPGAGKHWRQTVVLTVSCGCAHKHAHAH